MAILLLAGGVIAGTTLWPIYRRLQIKEGRFAQTFCVGGLTGLVVCSLVAWWSGQELSAAPKSLAAGLVGGSLAVGALVVTMRCLRLGPIASTTIVNNLGLFWPLAFDGLLLRPRILSYCVIAGLVGTVVTFVLLGRRRLSGTEEQAAVRVSPVAVPWMILLWGLSGMCMSAQTVGTFLEPGQSSTYMWGSSLAMVALLARPWRWGAPHWYPYREEVLIGVLWGLFYTLGPVMFLQALVVLPAAMVYPVAVAGPAVLMVPIGALIYQQPMGRYGLIGAMLGICSILAIAFG